MNHRDDHKDAWTELIARCTTVDEIVEAMISAGLILYDTPEVRRDLSQLGLGDSISLHDAGFVFRAESSWELHRYSWDGDLIETLLDEFEESPGDVIRRLKLKCDRHEQLRRQAEQMCERRTIERDEARAALAHQAEDAELGRALRDLVTQLRRLRGYKVPGHVWSPTGVIKSLCDEIWELASETPNSIEAKGEVRDVVCVSLQLMDTYNVEMIEGFARAAEKLDRRLTHIDEGGTWESAKALEGEEA